MSERRLSHSSDSSRKGTPVPGPVAIGRKGPTKLKGKRNSCGTRRKILRMAARSSMDGFSRSTSAGSSNEKSSHSLNRSLDSIAKGRRQPGTKRDALPAFGRVSSVAAPASSLSQSTKCLIHCMYVCMYVCMYYVCMYVCMYVCR